MSPAVADLIREGIRKLKQAGIDNPETSSRSILQHLLKMTPAQLQISSLEPVADDKVVAFRNMIEKRAARYPLQYLIGEIEFYNIKLRVDQRALIPRPETEILVENIIAILKDKDSPEVLDIGSGSGNIAIALAFNIANIKITAVDISPESLELARENAELNNVLDKIKFIQADCLQDSIWTGVQSYDAIVSNPPYVADSDIDALQPEIRLYEPITALKAGNDPLLFFKTIISKSKSIIKHPAVICFEVGIGQAEAVAGIMRENYGDSEVKIIKDLAGIDRVVIGEIPEENFGCR
jgi:release factor glutamine methyltransferase